MKIDDQTIRAAFEQHRQRYASEEGNAWEIPGHVECWQIAHQAFEQNSRDDFEKLYDRLRREWQVFRGARKYWSAERTFRELSALSPVWRGKHLSELSLTDAQPCLELLKALSTIKPLKDGVSVVAISKFLHFWNPKLFVIVDRGVMWQRVFQQDWLWRQVATFARNWLGSELVKPGDNCDLSRYLAILFWSADVVRDNPAITKHFARYVQKYSGEVAHDLPLETYEAAAMEWLLLGLTELPPPGVSRLS